MSFVLKRRSPRLLFAAWGLYWIALLALGGWLAAGVARAAPASGPGGPISVKLGLDGGTATLTALSNGRPIAGGSMTLLALALLIVGPPLLLWAAWLALPSRRRAEPVAALEPVAMLEPPPQRLEEWLEDPGYLDANSRRAKRQDAARRDAERDDRER